MFRRVPCRLCTALAWLLPTLPVLSQDADEAIIVFCLDETEGLNAVDAAGGDNNGTLEFFDDDGSQWVNTLLFQPITSACLSSPAKPDAHALEVRQVWRALPRHNFAGSTAHRADNFTPGPAHATSLQCTYQQDHYNRKSTHLRLRCRHPQ